MQSIESLIRPVADYPKPGVMFRDITPLLADAQAFQAAIAAMARPWADVAVDQVAGLEARGFIFGVALAQHLKAGFIPLRKPGKLPPPVRSLDYALEYGSDRLEVREDALKAGSRVLLVDDVLATGGTLAAGRRLLESVGAQVIGASVLMELDALAGRQRWAPGSEIQALLHY
ncbi:adenine phosphoribosyltransferase [Frateuria aurantia]